MIPRHDGCYPPDWFGILGGLKVAPHHKSKFPDHFHTKIREKSALMLEGYLNTPQCGRKQGLNLIVS